MQRGQRWGHSHHLVKRLNSSAHASTDCTTKCINDSQSLPAFSTMAMQCNCNYLHTQHSAHLCMKQERKCAHYFYSSMRLIGRMAFLPLEFIVDRPAICSCHVWKPSASNRAKADEQGEQHKQSSKLCTKHCESCPGRPKELQAGIPREKHATCAPIDSFCNKTFFSV